MHFGDDTLGVLQLLDGCAGMESFKWQFVRLESPAGVYRLRSYEGMTLPRQLWCRLCACEAWSIVLRAVLSVFIDARDGCYRGAACFPVVGSSNCVTIQTRMLKRDLSREQARELKALARCLDVRLLGLTLPRGGYWHDRLAPIPLDGIKGVVTLVAAGRSRGQW